MGKWGEKVKGGKRGRVNGVERKRVGKGGRIKC